VTRKVAPLNCAPRGDVRCLDCLISSVRLIDECITEQLTEDTDCSEFRYFSCVLQSGLRYVLFSYSSYNYLISQVMNGEWSVIPPLCMYVNISCFRLPRVNIILPRITLYVIE